jgi:hypothetical protein
MQEQKRSAKAFSFLRKDNQKKLTTSANNNFQATLSKIGCHS